MRIGINALFRGKPTGVANYIIHLVQNLQELDRSNQYYIFLTRANRGYFSLYRENFHPVLCPEQTAIPTVRRLWEQTLFPLLVHRYRIDLLHCPVNVLPLWAGRWRTAVTILDCQYLHASARHGFLRRRFNTLFMRASYRRADLVMTISNCMKEEIVGYFGGDGAKVAVTHLGHAFGPVAPCPGHPLAQCLGLGRPYLLFVGFPNHRKNLPGLIRAFALAQERLSERYDLVLCGDIGTKTESDYPAIRSTIAETGLKERVRLIGYLENEELRDLMAGARAFVLPSLYEGFGLPVVEAMACGTPVLVSDLPVFREIAGDAALYVDPHDREDMASGICRLLSDPGLRAELSIRGSARAAAFTWQETARKTHHCYRLAAGGLGA